MPDTERETVELDESAIDTIVERVAAKIPAPDDSEAKALRTEIAELKALYTTPQRTLLETEGIAPKPGEQPVFYGGDDLYTTTGESDAEVATNLYLAQVMLEHAGQKLSGRGREVMFKAAEKAITKASRDPAPIVTPWKVHPTVKGFIGRTYRGFVADATKAMTSTGANAGDEWVPTFASAELWRDVHLETVIANNFPRVAMPTNPYTLPTLDDDVTFRGKPTENTAVTASDLNTGSATLTAKTIQAEVNFSDELEEDSIIPVVPEIRANLVRRGAQTIDDLLVHGDTETGGTGNVNLDDAAPAAGSFFLQLDGIRKFAVVTNTAQTSNVAAALTSANFTTVQGLMGRYGARASDLRIITGVSTWLVMRTITEVLSVEKYGANATIIRGELGRFFNIPIILSEAIPGLTSDKVEADGKASTTAANNTKGWLVLVNTQGWRIGFRRELRLETFKDIQKGQNILVASFRQAQIPSGISTLHTATGRNLTV